jgi:hypothetical protein
MVMMSNFEGEKMRILAGMEEEELIFRSIFVFMQLWTL